ncbi:MAG: trp RNA-binding attenuation protein MtrB [Clostridia bacterium]
MENNFNNEDNFFVVKAKGTNVQVIGLTRGNCTKPQHTEVLDTGEVFIMQFTEGISAIKIRGNAEIITRYGTVSCERETKQ